MTRIKILILDGVGAEITGLDLRTMTDEEFAQVQATFNEQGLVFFRDQQLEEADHIALARRFGEININRFFAAHPEHPEIAMVTKEPDQEANIGGGWHTDHSYDHEPALGSILVARQLPASGGDTKFASMYGAYEALSDGLKKTLEGLNAVHSAKHIFGEQGFHKEHGAIGDRIGNPELAEALSDPVHPVVIRHPLSGKKALYVNPVFTLHFEGWTKQESQPLLDYLYSLAIAEENIHHFSWRPGSIAFWDNRATWHFAENDYQGQRRVMHRITIDGCALGR